MLNASLTISFKLRFECYANHLGNSNPLNVKVLKNL